MFEEFINTVLCDRRMQNLRQPRDKGQAITRFMYNAIVHPMEHTSRKYIIAISVVAVLFYLLFMSQRRKADFGFEDIYMANEAHHIRHTII
jgi:hypothetical protein